MRSIHYQGFANYVFLGEVALPGGKVEEGDSSYVETALREANEEIGLDPSLVDVVTSLESFTTKVMTRNRVLPVNFFKCYLALVWFRRGKGREVGRERHHLLLNCLL